MVMKGQIKLAPVSANSIPDKINQNCRGNVGKMVREIPGLDFILEGIEYGHVVVDRSTRSILGACGHEFVVWRIRFQG